MQRSELVVLCRGGLRGAGVQRMRSIHQLLRPLHPLLLRRQYLRRRTERSIADQLRCVHGRPAGGGRERLRLRESRGGGCSGRHLDGIVYPVRRHPGERRESDPVRGRHRQLGGKQSGNRFFRGQELQPELRHDERPLPLGEGSKRYHQMRATRGRRGHVGLIQHHQRDHQLSHRRKP
jgi:hypothetical protein